MFTLYALLSQTRNYIYVGFTNNLERRLKQHQSGMNITTRAYRPFVLFYTEVFDSGKEARIREKFLKSGTGKEFLKAKLKDLKLRR